MARWSHFPEALRLQWRSSCISHTSHAFLNLSSSRLLRHWDNIRAMVPCSRHGQTIMHAPQRLPQYDQARTVPRPFTPHMESLAVVRLVVIPLIVFLDPAYDSHHTMYVILYWAALWPNAATCAPHPHMSAKHILGTAPRLPTPC